MPKSKGAPKTKAGKRSSTCHQPTRLAEPEDELRHKLNNLESKLVNPHEAADILKVIKSEKLRNKLKLVLEGFRDYDPVYFNYDPCCRNLLTFVHIHSQNKHEAVSENRNVQRHHAGSVMARLHQVYIDKNSRNFRDALAQLEHVVHDIEDSRTSVVYKAEMAYLYFRLGPGFYPKALRLYSEVLEWIVDEGQLRDEEAPSAVSPSDTILTRPELMTTKKLIAMWEQAADPSMKNMMVSWCFQISQFYGKLLARPHMHILYKLDSFNVDELFTNICHLLNFVVKSGDAVFCGRALTEMADIYKIYELIGRKDERRPLPDGLTADQCMEKAVELYPDDVHVLQFAGRHFRQRATNTASIRRAVSYMTRAVEICPTMHVAHHQMALAYRAMWLIEGGYKEGKLHVNNDRQKPKKNKKYRQGQCSQSAYDRLAGYVGATGGPDQGGPVTVFPRRPQDTGTSARHFKKPDYFDELRTNNPPVKPKGKNHLESSQMHLEEAMQVNNTSPRYLIDLARVHISFGSDQHTVADLLEKADLIICDDLMANHNEAAYLNEQWGLFFSKFPDRREEAKSCFRKSLEYSVLGKQRSRVAFYKLCNVLNEQSQESDSILIAKETAFIYKLIEKYDTAREIIRNKLRQHAHEGISKPEDIMESALKNNPEIFALLFELLDILHREGNDITAFLYLMIGTQYITAFDCKPEQVDLARDILAHHRPKAACEFAAMFRWLHPCVCEMEEDGSEGDDDQAASSPRETDDSDMDGSNGDCSYRCSQEGDGREDDSFADILEEDIDVVLVSTDVREPLIDKLSKVLQEDCGLDVFQACTGANGDWMNLGCTTRNEGFDFLIRSREQIRTWLVDMDGVRDKNFKFAFEMLAKTFGDRANCVLGFSRHAFEASDNQSAVVKADLIIDHTMEKSRLIEKFVTAMPFSSFR